MPKFRKKPVVIEAWEWTGKSLADAQMFTQMNGLPDWRIGSRRKMTGLIIPTLKGDHVATRGDYIIKGVQGEFYPRKPEIFFRTYNPC